MHRAALSWCWRSSLARVDRLVRFLNAATKSLTTDLENIREIAKVGLQFQGIGLKKIQFITVPWKYSTAQPGRVEWLPEASELWQRIRTDSPLGKLRQGAINAGEVPGAQPSESPSESPSDSSSTSGSEEPSESGTSSSSPSDSESPSTSPSESADEQAQAEAEREAREAAGLCT